jgi:hypothetical protein
MKIIVTAMRNHNQAIRFPEESLERCATTAKDRTVAAHGLGLTPQEQERPIAQTFEPEKSFSHRRHWMNCAAVPAARATHLSATGLHSALVLAALLTLHACNTELALAVNEVNDHLRPA